MEVDREPQAEGRTVEPVSGIGLGFFVNEGVNHVVAKHQVEQDVRIHYGHEVGEIPAPLPSGSASKPT